MSKEAPWRALLKSKAPAAGADSIAIDAVKMQPDSIMPSLTPDSIVSDTATDYVAPDIAPDSITSEIIADSIKPDVAPDASAEPLLIEEQLPSAAGTSHDGKPASDAGAETEAAAIISKTEEEREHE